MGDVRIIRRTIKSALLAAIALSVFSQSAQAWNNDLTLYLWGASLSGKATLGQKTIPEQPIEADFDDLFDKLEQDNASI